MAAKRDPLRPSARKTRAKLLRTGRKAFAAKGLGGASLREDILAPSGVSAGSFYHQFEDKSALLVEIVRHDGDQIIETLSSGVEPVGASDPVERGRRLLTHLFDMADRHPEFVKIFVREYYSESREVRRVIRDHQDRTIAAMRVYYEMLREATGLPLDTDAIATILVLQNFSILNHYLGYPKKERAARRDWTVSNVMQLLAGGVLAMRLPEDERVEAHR